MTFTHAQLGYIVLAEILVPLSLAPLVLALPFQGRQKLQIACCGGMVCSAAAFLLISAFSGTATQEGPVRITAATFLARATDDTPGRQVGEDRPAAAAARSNETLPLLQPALRVDRLSAGLTALLSWLGLTALVSEPRRGVRENPWHIAAVLGLQGTSALGLVADDALTMLGGMAAAAAVAAAAIGTWGTSQKRALAERFVTVQILAFFGLAAATAIAAAMVSLMRAAPFGVPEPTSFGFGRLIDLVDQAQRSHPSAVMVQAQLSHWLLLAASVPLWLLAALFPVHGWFLPVWQGAPLSIRLWLGGIGTKFPLLVLLNVIGPLSGGRLGAFLSVYATAAVLGLLFSSCLLAAESDADRVPGTVVLAGSHLAVLYICAVDADAFLPLAVLSAGMVLLTISADAAGVHRSGDASSSRDTGRPAWLAAPLIVGIVATGWVAGGAGFEVWREPAAALWIEAAILQGWGGWLTMLAGLVLTGALVLFTSRVCANEASFHGSPQHTASGSVRPGGSIGGWRDVDASAGLRAVLFAWGLVAILASALTWIPPRRVPAQNSSGQAAGSGSTDQDAGSGSSEAAIFEER